MGKGKGETAMKKLCTALILALLIAAFAGCGQAQPELKGGYQNDQAEDGYCVTLSFDPADGSFMEFIDNRKVDAGTFEKIDAGTYRLTSERQEFEIVLSEDNVFEITLAKVNGGAPLQMTNRDDIPVEFVDQYDDEEKYQALLD